MTEQRVTVTDLVTAETAVVCLNTGRITRYIGSANRDHLQTKDRRECVFESQPVTYRGPAFKSIRSFTGGS
jgi:hypothetical protein